MGVRSVLQSQHMKAADATITEKKQLNLGEKTDQSSTVCQALKKKARQILSQNQKTLFKTY